jgi:hypothetical protein
MKNFVPWLVIGVFSLAVAPSASFAASPSAGIALAVKQTDHCSALTPSGWSLSSNPQGSTLDAESADQTMYAGWGVVQINRAM